MEWIWLILMSLISLRMLMENSIIWLVMEMSIPINYFLLLHKSYYYYWSTKIQNTHTPVNITSWLVCDLLICWRRKPSSFWKGCGMLCLLASFGTFGVREIDECSRGKNIFEERIKVWVVSTFSGIFLDYSWVCLLELNVHLFFIVIYFLLPINSEEVVFNSFLCDIP